ncbi:MAG: MFS transporter [Clostridia bacterium]|nr:MFS transporter [Clostridia bacterium]
MLSNDKRVKLGCYTTNISMAVVCNFSPLLFLTFRESYGISYSLLGFLILVNFLTQLSIDLVFSFFSHKFNIPLAVKLTPVLTLLGLVVYAVFPFAFPEQAYIGLLLGTVVFSLAGGLAEVLISPVIAALPSENPEREMSKLHSIYAWGVVLMVAISTLFFVLFGRENWQYLALLLTLFPALASLLFLGAKIPKMETPEKTSGALSLLKNKRLWLCVLAIFLGGASEVSMAQWSSSYLEQAVGLPKIWGDIFGVAFFAVMLGLGRSLYAKYGKNIEKILLLGAIGATVCYLTAAVSSVPVLGLIACALTGFCVSMLWPGSLVVASERFPQGGVFIYAMMAAGGDLGASVGPQLIGVITDAVAASAGAADIAQGLGITLEQLGMKLGMLVGMLFPLIAIFVYIGVLRTKKTGALPLSAQE